MSSKTKIVVLKMRELIYTAIFVALGIILIILLIYMFSSGKKEKPEETAKSYIPGIYTASITLNNQAIDVEVAVDSDHINSVRFVNLSESVATMYPFMQTALDSIGKQVCETQSLDSITYSDDIKYTANVLLKAIGTALDKAKITK
ncbi:MAG: hypothetical protein ACLRZ7_03565 [Lachnospiraceae bacterium]